MRHFFQSLLRFGFILLVCGGTRLYIHSANILTPLLRDSLASLEVITLN
ncbi:hypothetical protein Barb7_00211 [Bacteroidales bacterium Barb7]|nr:hypothetical protein Barb7_00211 [Bacteroidales bacterium Barb7]